MKRKYLIGLFLLVFSSCTKNKTLRKELDGIFYVSREISTKNSSTDTLYTYFNFNDPSKPIKVGFFKDGFLNSTWTYNVGSAIKEIEWAHYHDKNLNFDTNVFPVIDSVKNGDHYSKLLFRRGKSTIILSVSINALIKDQNPEINYDIITKRSLITSGIKIRSYKTKAVANGNKRLRLIDLSIELPNGQVKFVKGLFSFVDEDNFVEVSITTSIPNDFYANELFYGVANNFSIKNKSLYKH